MLLSELLAEYAGLTALARNSLRLHAVGIGQFGRTLGRAATLADFTDANLAKHSARRIAAGRSRATINAEFCKLLALWRFAAKLRYVEKWPTVKAPRMPERVPMAWTRDELGRVFACTQLAGPVGNVPGFLWWGALLSVLWETGERISAALAIQWSGVDLVGGTILVAAETRKGQTRDRLYRISPQTVDALAKLPPDRPPFSWPYNRSTLWNRYRGMLMRAGLPSDRRSQFHRIRRSFASHLKAAGGDATAALDHSSPRVTKAYIDPRICPQQSPVDLLFRPGG